MNKILLGLLTGLLTVTASAVPFTYSTSGVFSATGTNTIGSAGNTIIFSGVSSLTLNTFTSLSLGSFDTTGTLAPSGTFTLTISQTSPSVGSTATIGALSGSFTTNQSDVRILFSPISMSIGNIIYTLSQPVDGYLIVPPMSGGAGVVSPGTTTFQATASAVPEPASMALMGLGLVALGAFGRRRLSKQAV